jgi:hypothetical protein
MLNELTVERHRTMAIASAHKTKRTYETKPTHGAPLTSAPMTPSSLTWTHVPLVPQVALVGHLDGMPVAVIDQIGSAGFRAGLCNGRSVGVFRTLEESKKAVASAITATTVASS